uniref:Response regulator n=1 Tax=Fundidesulfovibrio putealis TaxID=270496 RepID=A0A7C4EJ16_9BACT
MRLLIIEDDPVNRAYMREILAPHASTVEAADGRCGLDAFREALACCRPFDAVLLDVCMPGMDGHQTLQKLRTLEQDSGLAGDAQAKVIMVSSLNDSGNISRAFFDGNALSYLVKPVEAGTLLEELRKFGLIV